VPTCAAATCPDGGGGGRPHRPAAGRGPRDGPRLRGRLSGAPRPVSRARPSPGGSGR
jgi:hypothetical protein